MANKPAYDATYALTQLLHGLHANSGAGYDATTALTAVLPQAQLPADSRSAFTLPNMASNVAPLPTGVAALPAATAATTSAVATLKTEKRKK